MSDKARILIVDDEPVNLNLMRQILKNDYVLTFAKSGPEAFENISKQVPDLLLLDIMMPGMDGYTVCQTLNNDPRYADIPVIFCSAMSDEIDETRGFEMGAVDYITKPVSAPVVKARVRTHLSLSNQKMALQQEVKKIHADLISSRFQALQMLGKAAEFKDNETGMHVVRMSYYSAALARATGWPEDQCFTLLNASPMHDVGKIGIPDAILLKPGRLNEEEMEVMRRHAQMGADIINTQNDTSPLFKMAASIAASHHEKWDGSGYPNGLSGEEIPIEGRIVAIADVFDALSSKRPYKDPWPLERILDLLHEEKGRHFDPDLVDKFIEILPEIKAIQQQWQD